MSVISTNISSLFAQDAIKANSRNMQDAMNNLSTGKRINRASDDAAGVAIASVMTADIRGLNQAVRNANDAISYLQVADGALIETTNMLQRMRELAVQATAGTYSSTQLAFNDKEYQALIAQIGKIATQTTFNGFKTAGEPGAASTITFGTALNGDADGMATITVTDTGITGTGLDLTYDGTADTGGGNLKTAASATLAVAAIDAALEKVNTQRANFGAGINQLTYAADNMGNISTNMSASRSRIEDTDYAVATTALAKTQIIQQAATAMLAQANQQPQSVMALLKG
jgi:flagellin